MKDIEELHLIKLRYYSKEIDYIIAKKLAQPFINNINERSKMIAKNYNQKPKFINFSSIMR
jgi:hypothetical protein